MSFCGRLVQIGHLVIFSRTDDRPDTAPTRPAGKIIPHIILIGGAPVGRFGFGWIEVMKRLSGLEIDDNDRAVLPPAITALCLKRRMARQGQHARFNIGQPVRICRECGGPHEPSGRSRAMVRDCTLKMPCAAKIIQRQRESSRQCALRSDPHRAKRLMAVGLSCRAPVPSLGLRQISASQPMKGSPT